MSKINRRVHPRKIILGLTGGIASGKSSVLVEFRSLGAKTLDCDVLARKAVAPGQPALKKIKEVFNGQLVGSKGLDRSAMAKIVFSDLMARQKLESIIHPFVRRKLESAIRKHRKGLLVVDIPLLFEAKFQDLVDKVAVIWVPEALQVARLRRRNGLTRSEALRRIRTQIPLTQKRKWADFVINNSRSFTLTRRQVRELYSFLALNGVSRAV